ncbi:MAG: molybdate ABC transporter substrate-binding protein [Alphaproteobacteria bacterium]
MRVRSLHVALAAWLAAQPVSAEPVTVFAAASLTDAMEQVAAGWAEAGNEPWRLSLGGSSTLARQIVAGAPADIFLSANVEWMDAVEAAGLLVPDSRIDLLANSLVLVAPADALPAAPVAIGPDLDLAALLGPDGRLAMADPTSVPAGIYGRQSLVSLGLWDGIAARVVATGDVRGTLALVARDEVPLGIVYATDAAISADVAVLATFPPESHAPITYPAARIAGDGPDEAAAAFAYLLSAEARAVFARHGFAVVAP